MFELLKKWGVPATVSLIVASLVTIVPLIFGVDSRYAKDDELKQLQEDIKGLSAQVSQMIGAQQSLIAVVTASASRPPVVTTPAPAPVTSAPAAGSAAPQLRSAPRAAPAPVPVPVPAAPVAVAPAARPSDVKKLEDINRDLSNVQRRVDSISNKY